MDIYSGDISPINQQDHQPNSTVSLAPEIHAHPSIQAGSGVKGHLP
jgi:hypothetical protein